MKKSRLKQIRRLLTYCIIIGVLCLILTSLHVVIKYPKAQLDPDPLFSTIRGLETTTEHTRPEWAINASALLFSPTKRDRLVRLIDCRKIFEGDREETHRAHMLMAGTPRRPIPDRLYNELTTNCSEFVARRGYIMEPASEEEANFPIAFSILMYKEAEQAERFLRSIYQPQNVYCIHVDRDSPDVLHQAVKNIASCLPNVFVASRLESIVYGGFSRLQADINCMTDLSKTNVSWKYFINQPSQAFPLRTNAELVQILKIYNGSNDIEGISVEKVPHMKNRIAYHHAFRYPDGARKPIVVRTARRKGKPPHGLNITKGSAYGVFSRDFVHFILNDQLSRTFLRWCRDTYSPDEHYWSTLHHTMANSFLHTPGGYDGKLRLLFLMTNTEGCRLSYQGD
jgi:beta-1,3-galactosyl-O-glycosyl-glycoprotein beta-1,6-N-acetylglucosaminyltransferase/N-acetyllactosaminide beta-1,6-N-acetylglucosaminyltransferase/mucin type N-acetylglucosaminyltransferase 3